MVVEVAAKKMLESRHFSICDLDKICDIVGARQSGDAYTLLRALHCVDYNAMDQELRNRIPLLVNEVLRQQSEVKTLSSVMLDGVTI